MPIVYNLSDMQIDDQLSICETIAIRIREEKLVPIFTTNFHGDKVIKLIPINTVFKPEIFLIEEYEIKSVLGDFGAGKVIKTMNFGPNEERTITVSSYKKSESSRKYSQNVLDSFSNESANELETEVQNEETSNISDSSEMIKSSDVSASISVGFGPIGGGDASATSSSSTTANSAREEMAKQISTAMDKHTAKSSASRNIEVNDTTTESVSEGSEYSMVRNLKNPNFRTMNLVLRQMEQEFITAIILKDVKIGFCNGTPESVMYAKLYEMDQLLIRVLDDNCVSKTKCFILENLHGVKDMAGEPHNFIEEVEEPIYKCIDDKNGKVSVVKSDKYNRYWRKKRDLIQTLSQFDADLQDYIKTNGIIMDIKKRVLRTDGIVADVFLGHGEALDCFNQTLQDQATNTEVLKNDEIDIKNKQEQLKIDIINEINDPIEKVKAFRDLFFETKIEENNNL